MSKKVEIDLVKMICNRNLDDCETTKKIIDQILEELPEEEEKPPPVKKQFVILQPSPDVGWAVQIEEGESPYTCETKIREAISEYNMSPKGRRMPVKTTGEAMEIIPARIFKEAGMWIKTKEPVVSVQINNKLT